MTNVALIGFGYWGPNLLRNFSNTNGCIVHTLIDSRPERLEVAKKMYPHVNTSSNVDDVFYNEEIDAIIIATPVYTHYDLAKKALENEKHVLVEKPMTSDANQALELINLALSKQKLLMVDHTFLYTSAVQEIKKLIDNNVLGQVQYFDSTRINLGLIQSDVNVLWDLAPHDLSILSYLIDKTPVSVQATGISHTGNGIENIAYLTINYKEEFIAHFNCSWSSPVKIRSILIGGTKKMVVYDDLQTTEKIKLYDSGFDVKSDDEKRNLLISYRTGDIFIPNLPNLEALSLMAKDFIHCIQSGNEPISSAKRGYQVVKILEAAQNSIKNKGVEVSIK